MKSITVEKLLGNNKNYQQVTGNEESLKRVRMDIPIFWINSFSFQYTL